MPTLPDAMLVRGPLQSDAGKGNAMMNMVFGKAATKKFQLSHWGYDGVNLIQFADSSERSVVARFLVLAVVRVTSKQLEIDVRSGNEVFKLALKASSANEMKPWYEAMSKSKEPKVRQQQRRPQQPKPPVPVTPPSPHAKLDELRQKFESLEAEVASIRGIVESNDVQKMYVAKNQLAQISGHVDKLQFVGVDSVVTSDMPDEDDRQRAKSRRKELNADLDTLRLQVSQLYDKIVRVTGSLSPMKAGQSTPVAEEEQFFRKEEPPQSPTTAAPR